LITLEGGEGAGKSLLATAIAADLAAAGRPVVKTREPGGSPGADEIRALIVTGAGERWSTLSEALLLAAARRDHIERVLAPGLAAGAWIICDRYVDSTRAYQGAGRGLDADVIETLARLIEAPQPDLTIVLDAPPALALARSQGARHGETRYEAMTMAFHERVRAAFLAIAAAEPGRCVVIDAAQPVEAVHAAARAAIAQRLGP
jgi:dTMP kinase